MRQVNVHDAKTHLSKLIEDVEAGEEIVIARAGRPAAKLVPFSASPSARLGVLKGAFVLPSNFSDPIPEDTATGSGADKA